MHPYEGLPDERFWSRGVAQRLWSEIRFMSNSRWRIRPGERVASAGSCFAQHIARHLPALGLKHHVVEQAPARLTPERAAELQYGVFSARYGNIYSVRQLRQLIEFAFGVRPLISLSEQTADGWVDLLRPGVQAEGYDSLHDLECDRLYHLECVRRMFLETQVFIFTLGLTEYWYHRDTGIALPVCPGTRVGEFDPQAYGFANARCAEVADDLRWCIDFLAGHNPQLRWIFTVSPVALAATATERHVLLATCASKAVLRAAVDEVVAEHPQCEYFPSLEITSSAASFGQFLDSDLRSISPRGVQLVMRVFREALVEGDGAPPGTARDTDLQVRIRAAVQAECDESFYDPGLRPG